MKAEFWIFNLFERQEEGGRVGRGEREEEGGKEGMRVGGGRMGERGKKGEEEESERVRI